MKASLTTVLASLATNRDDENIGIYLMNKWVMHASYIIKDCITEALKILDKIKQTAKANNQLLFIAGVIL